MLQTFYVGAKGVVRAGNSCLVLKKGVGENAYWDIPGGRIDGSETLEQTLNRELKEELPTMGDFSINQMLGAYRLGKDLPDGQGLVLVFYKIVTEPFEVTLSAEHSDFQWVTHETLSELLTSSTAIESGYYEALTKALA